MKKILLTLLCCYTAFTFAQTTLNPGDIMFVGLNADPAGSPTADEFNILFLEPVTVGTEIYFTDMGYTGNSAPYFQQNANNGCPSDTGNNGAVSDGMVKWTATSTVTAGSQLVIRVRIDGVSGATSNIGTVAVVVNPQGQNYAMSLSGGGEAVHAFQGTINGSNQVTSANMLASIHYDDGAWDATLTTCQFTSSASEDPATGYEVEYGASHYDNGYYSGDMTLEKSALQAAILDISNWTRSSSETYTFPITSTLSNTNLSLEKDFKMYPNPTSNMVYVNSNVSTITIYNSLGKAVLETKNNAFSTKSLSSGIYVVKIEDYTNNRTAVKKLIKK